MKPFEILICGDFYLDHSPDGQSLFDDFVCEVRRASFAIVNLEAPETGSSTPISKTGPSIKTSEGSIKILSEVGFHAVTLATNHIMDFGSQGLQDTFERCAAHGVDFIGAGRSLHEASFVYYKEHEGLHFAFLNFAENEFSTTDGDQPGANPLDTIQNYNQIREARNRADKVFVIVHGGHEGHPLPSPRMKSMYRFFIDAGADAVLGHHTHCYSGYEVYGGKPIFYGLGNFMFTWPGKHDDGWYTGYAVRFLVEDGEMKFEIVPYVQNKDRRGVRRMTQKERVALEGDIASLNQIIADDARLAKEFENFINRVEKLYLGFLEPHGSRIVQAFQNRGLLGSFVTKRKRTLLLNLIRCESHRDVILKILTTDSRT